MTVENVSRPGFSHGGARIGAGRKRGVPNRWPAALATEIRRLGDEVARLRLQRRNEQETLPALLRRLTEIERVLKGTDLHVPARATRRRPLGA
jgi:hypothetical protein